MDLENFNRRREALLQDAPQYRNLCIQCLQPEFSCYCCHIQKFDPKIKFVILIHPIEMKRRIATGRMSHLCLENSELIMGQDYSNNHQVNKILNNPAYQASVLYPGPTALNLSEVENEKKFNYFPAGKTPVVFVIDGTWATARKTMHQSRNLKSLPRICFTPPHQSQFRVRKQPRVDCYSTIEAIHQIIELLGSREGFDVATKKHEALLYVFNKMVERQLEFIRQALENSRTTSYRRRPQLIKN